ncbi:hypothetical protein KKC45_01655 [Patescibacteria group bacterium]|nr:hypothetical protein [Patescibacteria group bacterium]
MSDLKFKKLKKILRFSLSDCLRVDCSYGWIGLLLFFLILNFSVAMFNIFLYHQIDKGEIFVVEGNPESNLNFSQINKEDLDVIVYDFNLKANSFQDLKERKNLGIVDPSL